MNKYVIALYIRLSLEDVKTESMSIQNQLLSLHKFADMMAEAENAEVLEFIDNGYSGTNFERPAVQELLELVQSNKINCIIVKDFSRFGRNAIETGYFIERVFPLFKTRFISINDGFDTINYKGDTGGMEVAFKYLINEYYSKDLSEKSKSAKYLKMSKGEYQSKICCYGYKKGGNNRLEIDEEAAAVVRTIFNLSLQGSSAHQIAQELYRRGTPTPGEYKVARGTTGHDVSRTRGMWQRSTVLRILYDERYTGTYIMGKRTVREVGGTRSRLKDESEWYKIPDHHPAIIDKSVYEQVQSQLVRFKCEKKNRNEFPLRSKVFCGVCEHAMYRSKKDPQFSCRFARVDESYACRDLSILERELEAMLFEVMYRQAVVILNLDDAASFAQLSSKLAVQTGYEKQIQDCHDEKRRLYERLLLKEIDIDAYRAEKAEYDLKLNNLNRLHTAIATVTAQMQSTGEEKAKRKKLAHGIVTETKLTQELADALIDKVLIYPDNRVEIAWKIRNFAETTAY